MSIPPFGSPPYKLKIGSSINSGTSGSILYIDSSGNLAQDNSNLFWDATNHRLGIGTTNPGATLQLASDAGTAASGIKFGSAGDTDLYRSAAGVLQTDSQLLVKTTGGSTTAFQVQNSTGTSVLNVDTTNQRVGIGTTSPTAVLHLKAGTATANTAPLKLTAGTNLTTPELGAIEFTDDGTNGHLYITLNVSGTLTRVQII